MICQHRGRQLQAKVWAVFNSQGWQGSMHNQTCSLQALSKTHLGRCRSHRKDHCHCCREFQELGWGNCNCLLYTEPQLQTCMAGASRRLLPGKGLQHEKVSVVRIYRCNMHVAGHEKYLRWHITLTLAALTGTPCAASCPIAGRVAALARVWVTAPRTDCANFQPARLASGASDTGTPICMARNGGATVMIAVKRNSEAHQASAIMDYLSSHYFSMIRCHGWNFWLCFEC